MNHKILNITNGNYFNEYFLSHFGGEAVPLCEAMMDGETVTEIYSEKFIALRSKEHNVSTEEYQAKMQAYHALNDNEYTELHLWFGKDTFCQANLLTLLAYLEQMKFGGKVFLNYIDDETFEVLEKNIGVELGLYQKLYEKILILKQKPAKLGILFSEAIDLYFDYHSNEGALPRLIRENSHKDKTALICLLLENSKDYGLSDLLAEKLIEKYRSGGSSFMNLKERAKKLKTDIPAVFLALKEKQTPWYAKVLAAVVVVYALSPIDLLPDFIPVLGYLDDVIILPTLIAWCIKCIPSEVFEDCRTRAQGMWGSGKPEKWYYAVPFVLIWLAVIALIVIPFI